MSEFLRKSRVRWLALATFKGGLNWIPAIPHTRAVLQMTVEGKMN